jgi:hypothetical protein
MTSIEELLERAAAGGEQREAAVGELVDRGPATAHAILDQVARTQTLLVPWSQSLLLETADASLLPRALEALGTMPSELGCTAYPLLGHLGERAATRPLLAHFLDDELGPRFREMAAHALAKLRDPAALAPIRARLHGWFGADRSADVLLAAARVGGARSLMPAVAGAVTLAALGDHEFDDGVYALVSTPKSTLRDLADIRSVYPRIALALGHMVRPGLIAACQAALSRLSEESKEEMAAVLGRIGTRSAIELLVAMTRSRRRATAEVAAGWLHIVAGAPLVEQDFRDSSASWWERTGSSLTGQVVYLRGAAWTVSRFFEEVERWGSATGDPEVDIVTGKDVPREQRMRAMDRSGTLDVLARELGPCLAPGKLHRYGYSFEPE